MKSKNLSRKTPQTTVKTAKKTDKSLGSTLCTSSKKRPHGPALALRHEGFLKSDVKKKSTPPQAMEGKTTRKRPNP